MQLKISLQNKNHEQVVGELSSALTHQDVVQLVDFNNGDIFSFYRSIARKLGKEAMMKENIDGNKTGEVFTEIRFPYRGESKSFSHSDTRQPFHTDGAYESNSPQICYFFCKESALFGGSTIFIRSHELIDILRLYDSELLHQLKTTEVTFLKGNDFKKCLIIDHNNNLNWNWYRCDQSLEINLKFHKFLESKIFDGGLYFSVKLSPGEALFFNDSKVLHGRNSFIGARWLVKSGIHV